MYCSSTIFTETWLTKISAVSPVSTFKRDRVTRITDMLGSYLQYSTVGEIYIHRWLQCTLYSSHYRTLARDFT
jgi:hypothetical protein